MATREIPRDEWLAFFDSFSRQHEGWLSTIEILGAQIGAQIAASEQPLAGITADLKGSDVISILVSVPSGGHVAHMIRAPTHVHLKESAEGAHEALHIESSSGATTLLRFRASVAPGLLDGLAAR
jgi:hypothetical protein